MPAPHKDVPLFGAEYRINMLTAADGSWLVGMFSERYAARKQDEETKRREAGLDPLVDDGAPPPPIEIRAKMMATFLMAQLNRKETKEVYEVCLNAVARYEVKQETRLPMPIIVDGRYDPPELEFDGPLILELVRETLALRIAPFFSDPDSSLTGATTDSNK